MSRFLVTFYLVDNRVTESFNTGHEVDEMQQKVADCNEVIVIDDGTTETIIPTRNILYIKAVAIAKEITT